MNAANSISRRLPFLLAAAALAIAARGAWAQAPLVENNPSIIALEESDPRSPEQLMFAVQVAYGFDRLDVLALYGERLIAAAADDSVKVRLHQQFGSPMFIKLSDRVKYGDEMADFANAVLAAAGANARAEDRLRQLALGAQSDDEITRRGAVVELLKAGDAAAPILLNALSAATTETQQARLETALVAMGRDATQPLIAALESDNAAVAGRSASALGRLDAKTSISYLIGMAVSETHPGAPLARRALKQMVGAEPTLAEGLILLRRKMLAIRGGDLPTRPEIDNTIRVYKWDNDANTVLSMKAPIEVARYDAAARLSRDLARLSDAHDDQLSAMLVLLQDAQLKAGPDQPLNRNTPFWKVASATRPNMLEEALDEAVERNWTPAATAAIELLGESGEVTLLESSDGRPRPLAAALTHPDRRIRYAAMRAIMQLNPKDAYPGSSSLLDALEYFIRATGRRRILVAHPNTSGAQTVVGLLRAQSYDGIAANSGRRAIQLAQKNPDIEMILLSGMLNMPSVGETITYLRQDPRMSKLPIGIMARESGYARAESIAKDFPLTIAMPRLHSVSAAAVHLARLEALATDVPPQQSRIVQALASLRVMRTIAGDREQYGYYEIFRSEEALIAAIQQPPLTAAAADVLGQLGTSRSQRVLMILALQQGADDQLRVAALRALQEAVALRGLQLTNAEIQDQQRQLRNAPLADEMSKRIGSALLKIFKGESVDMDALQGDVSS